MAKNLKYLIGVDEVGRGPLAGPITICVFCISRASIKKHFAGIKDSKKLSPTKREEWFKKVNKLSRQGICEYRLASVGARIIDKRGITFSTRLAISRALKYLDRSPNSSMVLLDGGLKAPKVFINQKTIIKGDEKEPIIALASVVAKVRRDRYLDKLSKRFPKYGFEKHKGYGTSLHIKKLKKFGLSPEHRRSFLKGVTTRVSIDYIWP